MNPNIKNLAVFATTILASISVAQAQPTLAMAKVTVSASVLEQGALGDNGTLTTGKAAVKKSITAANLIAQLAKDENANGNWPNAFFPAGAKLGFNNGDFVVYVGTNVLLDVSDQMSWTVSGNNDLIAGSYYDTNQYTPPYTRTDVRLVTITYGNISDASTLHFSVTGVGTVTTKATTPARTTGKYTVSTTVSFTSASGEGVYAGADGVNNGLPVDFIVTGFTVSGSGSASTTVSVGGDSGEQNGNGIL